MSKSRFLFATAFAIAGISVGNSDTLEAQQFGAYAAGTADDHRPSHHLPVPA